MMTRRTALIATPLALGACATAQPPLPEGQHPLTLDLPAGAVRCWLHLPTGYHATPASWPLIVFMHGSGERGSDLEVVKFHGPPKLLAAGADWPAIVCSPQLEAGARWSPDRLHALLLALQARLRIAPDRVLATGLSLGGMGAWDWAAAYPGDLAAIAPVCGFGDPRQACRALKVPVRAYHGDADPVVPLARQQASVDALRACGGTVQFVIYPGVGHNAWDTAYNDPDLLPWLLKQRRAT